MKYLKNEFAENIKCGFWNKNISSEDEIEYSREHCTFFCCPDHTTAWYFENEGSTPVNFEEAQEMIKKGNFGWNFNH